MNPYLDNAFQFANNDKIRVVQDPDNDVVTYYRNEVELSNGKISG